MAGKQPPIATAWVAVTPETVGFRKKVEKDLRDLNTTASQTGSEAGTNWSKSFVDAFKKNKVRLSDTGLDQAEREYLAAQARMEKTTLAGAKKRTDAEKEYSDALEDSVKASKEFGPWSGEYKKSLDAVTKAQHRLNQVTRETVEEQEALQAEVEASSESLANLREELDGIENAVGPAWSKSIRKNLHIAFTSVGGIADDAGRDMGIRLSKSFKDTVRKQNVGGALSATLGRLSGARMLADFAESASNAASNADRLAVSLGDAGIRLGGVGALAFGATGGILALSGGLGSMLSTALVLPGILTSVAVGVTVFRVALQDTANVLPDVTEAYRGLGNVIKENFWARAAEPMRDAAFRLLPVLSAGLAEVSNQFGGWAVAISSVVASADGLRWIGHILENIGVMANVMGDAVGNFTNGLLELTFVGSTYLPRLGGALNVLMYGFENFVQKNTENGNIFRWVENGITEFKNLGAVIAGTFSIFGSLYEASRRAGGPSGFGFLRTGIESVSNALKTAEWQDALTSLFSGAYEGLGFIGEGLVSVADGFRVISPALGTVFSLAGETIGALLQELGAFMAHPAVSEGVVNFFTSVRDSVADTLPDMTLVAPAFKAIATMAGQLIEAIAGVFDAALETFAPAFIYVSESAAPLIPLLSHIVQNIIRGMVPAVQFFAGLIGKLLGFIIPLIGRLSEMEWLWKGVGLAIGLVIIPLVAIAGPLMFLVGTFFRVLGVIRFVIVGFTKLASGFRNFGGAVKNTVSNSKTMTAALNGIKKAFGFLKKPIEGLISRFGGKGLLSILGVAGKRFIGLLGPIGAVISIVGLLVDAVKYAWNNFEWFRNGVTGVWNWIKGAISNVVTWFTDTAMPALGTALTAVGGFFSGLWVDYVQPVWRWIRNTIGGFTNWFTETAIPGVQNAVTRLGDGFNWLYTNKVKPVFNGIKKVIDIALWPVKVLLGGLYLLVRDVIGPGFVWLYEKAVLPAFKGIKNAISNAWNNGIKPAFNFIKAGVSILGDSFAFVKDRIVLIWGQLKLSLYMIAFWIMSNVIDKFKQAVSWLGYRFQSVKDRIVSIWTALRNALRAGYDWININVFGPIKRGISWVGDRFSAVRTRIIEVWNNLKSRLKAGYDAINSSVFGPIKRGIGWVRDRFVSVRDRIVNVWHDMRTKLFNGWVRIRDAVFNPLKRGVDLVKRAFEKAQDGIGKAWDKIKSKVKEPIATTVNKVINPFIGGYNDLNDFWKGEDLEKIKGFAKGGIVGYSGGGVLPGYQSRKRDDVLTPMRSGEGVLVPEVVRGLGASFVHTANSVGNSGGVNAVRRWASSGQGYAKGGVVRPLRGGSVSSGYGNRAGGFHDGIDIAAPIGTPVYAAKSGTVRRSHYSGYGGGNEVQIVHDGGLVTWYSHMSKRIAQTGQSIKAGQTIGEVGSTGNSTGPHLHFAVFQGDWPNHRNPNDFLGGMLKGDGTGGGSMWQDPLDFVKNRVLGKFNFENALSGLKDRFANNKFVEMGSGIAGKAIDGVLSKAASLADPIINAVDAVKDYSSKTVAKAANRAQVNSWAIEALKTTGQLGYKRQRATVEQAFIESGGDPNAVNNWDSNAKNGDPSKGIMQTIGATFRSYAMPGRTNILDPVDNMIAAIRYVVARYGSIENIWPTRAGYSLGGVVDNYSLFDGGGWLRKTGEPQLIQHKKSRPDAVLTARQWRDQQKIAKAAGERLSIGGKDNIEMHVHANNVDADQAIRRGVDALAWEMKHKLGG